MTVVEGPEWVLIEMFIKALSYSHMNRGKSGRCRCLTDMCFYHISTDNLLCFSAQDWCVTLKLSFHTEINQKNKTNILHLEYHITFIQEFP